MTFDSFLVSKGGKALFIISLILMFMLLGFFSFFLYKSGRPWCYQWAPFTGQSW